MNTLILSTDGMGGTILQRLITILYHLEQVKIINIWDMLNGGLQVNSKKKLIKVWPEGGTLDYSQSLAEIETILKNADNNVKIVSRLSKWHLDDRKDEASEKINFYNFCKKFYDKHIICIRKNLFEHAMSLSIRNKSTVSNIIYRNDRNKVLAVEEVDEDYFIEMCQKYINYHNWVDKHFPNAIKIYYEDLITNADQVLKSLTGYTDTFKNYFGTELSVLLQKEYDFSNSLITGIPMQLSKQEQLALIKYKTTTKDMAEHKMVGVYVPVKNTTLTDKKKQIKNFDQCLNKFHLFAKNHNWIDQSNATYDFWNKKELTN